MRQRDNRSDTTAKSNSRRRWRLLRHLGLWAPIAVSLAVVLFVAGSLAVIEMVRDVVPGTGGEIDGGTAGGRRGARSVPLQSLDLDVDRPVDPNLGRAGTAADELQQRGHIGNEDELTRDARRRDIELGSRVLTRTRQEHRGIPVFAADVMVTSDSGSGRIIKIHGHPAPDIELDTTTPANDYATTVSLAEALLSHSIVAEDEGTLLIMPVDGGYRLAWLGRVAIDRGPEEVVFDAETGAVLHREPRIVRAPPTPFPQVEGDR